MADKITLSWWQLGLFVIVAGFAAYLGAYFRKRGENLANEKSFEGIRSQLQKTTRDTEEIKTVVARRTWLSQTQWSAREKLYSAILTHLQQLEMSLGDRCDFFQMPGSEYDEACTESEGFLALSERGRESTRALRELLGPSSLYLSDGSLSKIEKLLIKLWNAGEDSICTADYVRTAFEIVSQTRKAIQAEARSELFGGVVR